MQATALTKSEVGRIRRHTFITIRNGDASRMKMAVRKQGSREIAQLAPKAPPIVEQTAQTPLNRC